MQTLQDLKDNRETIIEVITEEVGAENLKEVMQVLAKYVGFKGYFGMNAKQFTKAVIKDSGIQDKIIMREGAIASRRIEEMNQAASRKLIKNI